MIFTSLASSSAGNAYTLDDGETKLLIECGLTAKKLQELLNFKLCDYAGCLVSHEHKDHSKAVKQIEKSGISLFMSNGTAEALQIRNAGILSCGQVFDIGTFSVLPFPTFHDAAEPMGFLIRSNVDGERLLFATDTVNLGYFCPNIDYLAIEANYKASYLERSTHIPEKVKYRITNSHFEIDMLCNYLRKCDLSKCKEIFLLHLSDAFSRETEFTQKVQEICKNAKVKVCKK